MDIPVIKKTKQGFEAHVLNVSDIWYVSVENNRDVVYHTKDDKYYQPTSMEQVYVILKEQGFDKLDRGVLANMENITHLDANLGKVYFENEISQQSKYATVAFSNLRRLKKYLVNVFEKKKD